MGLRGYFQIKKIVNLEKEFGRIDKREKYK